jgi:hypothetical protein
MSDARWLDVQDDLTSAIRHFSNAVAIHAEGLSTEADLQAYKGRMAFMQAMQAGYSSLETALERIFEINGEQRPTSGRAYRAHLIRRAAREIPGERPAIIEGDLVAALHEARQFRQVARRGYDDFQVLRAAPSAMAAMIIAERIGDAVAAFKAKIERK